MNNNHSSTDPDLRFRKTISMLPMLSAHGWTWELRYFPIPYYKGSKKFWVGTDPDGGEWLVKMRGCIGAYRERAFSIIAQALGILCQSSTFLLMPGGSEPILNGGTSRFQNSKYQGAIHLIEPHDNQPCNDSCPLRGWRSGIHDVRVFEASGVTNSIDFARGSMLGHLLNQYEPAGLLFTKAHTFVQIDNEYMLHSGPVSSSQVLLESHWFKGEDSARIQANMHCARKLCREITQLRDDILHAAAWMPETYKPAFLIAPDASGFCTMNILTIKIRAEDFLRATG